jgi:hypothetical protein
VVTSQNLDDLRAGGFQGNAPELPATSTVAPGSAEDDLIFDRKRRGSELEIGLAVGEIGLPGDLWSSSAVLRERRGSARAKITPAIT